MRLQALLTSLKPAAPGGHSRCAPTARLHLLLAGAALLQLVALMTHAVNILTAAMRKHCLPAADLRSPPQAVVWYGGDSALWYSGAGALCQGATPACTDRWGLPEERRSEIVMALPLGPAGVDPVRARRAWRKGVRAAFVSDWAPLAERILAGGTCGERCVPTDNTSTVPPAAYCGTAALAPSTASERPAGVRRPLRGGGGTLWGLRGPLDLDAVADSVRERLALPCSVPPASKRTSSTGPKSQQLHSWAPASQGDEAAAPYVNVSVVLLAGGVGQRMGVRRPPQARQPSRSST